MQKWEKLRGKNENGENSSPVKENWIGLDKEMIWLKNDNISLVVCVCLYKQEKEHLRSLWDLITFVKQ